MKLLTEEVRKALPALYATEDTECEDKVLVVKYFTPDSNWTWYACEGSPEEGDFRFFGYVEGFEKEWGYFLLSELTGARGLLGLPIERDLYFKPVRFVELAKQKGMRYRVFNVTDGVYASEDLMTKEAAEYFVQDFTARFYQQGYYASVRGRIPIMELQLKIEEIE